MNYFQKLSAKIKYNTNKKDNKNYEIIELLNEIIKLQKHQINNDCKSFSNKTKA